MQIGFDFGGTLIKISCYFKNSKYEKFISKYEDKVCHRLPHGENLWVNLLFQKKRIKEFYEFLNLVNDKLEQETVYCTGGGSFFYQEQI